MNDKKKKISYPFTPEGKERLAQILKQARGVRTFPEFSRIVGLNYGTLWEIEGQHLEHITEKSLEKLAQHFSSDPRFSKLTKDSLITLIMSKPSALVLRQGENSHLTLVDLWPLVERLSDRDKALLLERLDTLLSVKPDPKPF